MPQAIESKQLEHGERALTKTWDLNTYGEVCLVKCVGCYVDEKGEFIRKAGEQNIPYRE